MLVPVRLRPLVRQVRNVGYDAFDWAARATTGKLAYPRRSLRELVGGAPIYSHIVTGERFALYLKTLARLRPEASVLDTGCGVGRMAQPLKDYLRTPRKGGRASYTGFDPNEKCIRWCKAHIEATDPAFRFYHADLYHELYNPGGREKAESYRFPVGSGTVDVAFAGSLYTHLFRAAAAHYLAETARALRPGGTFLSTWFLLNEEVESRIEAGKSRYRFDHTIEDTRIGKPENPTVLVAHEERWVRAVLEREGLVVETIHPGDWSGYGSAIEHHDLVVAAKPE
ncbi:MAG TPA: class I SAM-dependent methyltransferase [Candidatus Thermoplasmatota archaeon]|nr:class I SAM-dependent methyltransferase [Candidatus Thermoplasmatota archaeon]